MTKLWSGEKAKLKHEANLAVSEGVGTAFVKLVMTEGLEKG